MIRTLLRPTTFARAAPRNVLTGRSVTTRAPTNSSGSPTTEISGTLAPGEEVDPQRMSLFPVLSPTCIEVYESISCQSSCGIGRRSRNIMRC